MPFQPGQSCQLGIRNRVNVGSAFGLALAERWFGLSESELAKMAGRFTKGKSVGQVRGWIVWVECKRGGWHYSLGGVIKPGMKFAHLVNKWDDASRLVNASPAEFFQGIKRVDSEYGHDWRKEEANRKAQVEKLDAERQAAASANMEEVMEKTLTPESLALIPDWALLNGIRTAYLSFRVMKQRMEAGEEGLESSLAACRVMKRKFYEEASNRGLDLLDDASDLSKPWVELTAPTPLT